MPITIGSNISSLRAVRELGKHTTELSGVSERLSSGLRITKASDDSSSIAIADSLKVGNRVFTQGVRNLNDGISLLNIADGALEQLSNIVTRVHELAEQSSNGVLGTKQRKALDAEAQALSKEFTRIAQTTTFNGLRLFTGQVTSLTLQGGFGIDGGITSGVGGRIGSGTFATQTTTATEALGTVDHALRDLNGDGVSDLITTGRNGTGNIATNIRFGSVDGTFGAATEYASSIVGTAKEQNLTDLNGDGVLDLVTIGTAGSTRVMVRMGNNNGTFGSETIYSSGGTAQGLTVGDINGDGIPDLAINSTVVGVATALGRGDGTFGAFSTVGGKIGAVDLTDVNGDGILDALSGGTTTGAGTVAVQLGNGDGTFGAATEYSTQGSISIKVSSADFNTDGIPDLVAVNGGVSSISVLLGNGNGTFGAATHYSGNTTSTLNVSIGDINGDGIPDLAMSGVSGAAGEVQTRLGNGDGTFGAATTLTGGTSYSKVSLEEIDGDGVVDLLASGVVSAAGGLDIRRADTVDGVAPILPIDLKNLANARQALSILKKKGQSLSAQRGQIGAFESRLNSAVRALRSSSENYTAAESRIRDADIAHEAARMALLKIRQQATIGILAQANQQPAIAMQLLSTNSKK